MMKIMVILNASAVLIRLEGIGRFRVRSMRSSHGHSWYWFNEEAPDASMNIPATGISDDHVRSPGLTTRAAKAVNVTASEIGNLVRLRITRKPEVRKGN
jgi:hypothetical protein